MKNSFIEIALMQWKSAPKETANEVNLAKKAGEEAVKEKNKMNWHSLGQRLKDPYTPAAGSRAPAKNAHVGLL